MLPDLRKKRIWTVRDFADHVGWHFLRARRYLLRLHRKHGGALLIPSDGVNRGWRFYKATLMRLEPDLFAPIECLEARVDELEEGLGETRADLRRTMLHVGWLTGQDSKKSQDIRQLKLRFAAA